MKSFPFCLLAAFLALNGCQKQDEVATSKPSPTTNAPTPLPSGGGYFGAIARAKQNSEKTIDTVGIQKAIQEFNIQEGRNPADLNELVTNNYLKSIPTPPYGMKIEYDAGRGLVKIVQQ